MDGAALSKPVSLSESEEIAASVRSASSIRVGVTHALGDVEGMWRAFEAEGIDSPGQSFDFIKLWIETQQIAEADQLYVYAEVGGAPVALLPLHRRRVFGIRFYSWFPGTHVGCNAPLIDRHRIAAMSATQRRSLWRAMRAGARGVDLVYLQAVPRHDVDGADLFSDLGQSLVVDNLYRCRFGSWAEADKQRSKSRRKHDRQQGERLDAMGDVSFEEIEAGEAALPVLDVLFAQRAARFAKMGVADPFAAPSIRGFYDQTARRGRAINLRLHALRLNGEIVAVRYNVARGDRLFCLISSMSDDPKIQAGSPGKQCLLRVMQSVFDAGYSMFDMGAGLTDEKRHWCNVEIPVRQHYLPLTRRGALAASAHRMWQDMRGRIKSNARLLGLAKSMRALLLKLPGRGARPASEQL